MPPLKDFSSHSIVISKFFQRGFFILVPLRTKNFTLVTSTSSFMYSLFHGPSRSLYNKYVFYSKCN